MDYDVIIAGGGPAGSTTAAYLAMQGRRVLVLERERFPRFHLGESLLPFGNDLFKELGVFEEIDRRYIHKPGARFIQEGSGDSFTYYFDTAIDPARPYAYQVQRGDFDLLLLENAVRLGAEVRQETEVRKPRFHEDYVEVDIAPAGSRDAVTTLRAPMFVDATGRDTLLARQLGGKVADDAITTNVACYTQYRGCQREPGADEGNFSLIMFEGGWWWFIPFKGTDASIGVVLEKSYTTKRRGMTPEQLFDGAVAEQQEIKKFLAGAERLFPVETTGNWSYRCDRYRGDRFVMVGDSAAFIDPLFSTGVLMAMMGARFAAEAIDEAFKSGDFRSERFANYEAQCVAGADRFKSLVHEFYGENFRRMLLASERNPAMCAVITSMLAGDVYKPRVWHGVVKRGFSHLIDQPDVPRVRIRDSRQVKRSGA